MPNVKGTAYVTIRALLKKAGPQSEEKMRALLSEKEWNIFQSVMPVSWIPVDIGGRIAAAAAETLFPGDPKGIWKMAKICGTDNIKGIYRPLMRILSVSYLGSKAASLWKIYYDQGENKVLEVNEEEKYIVFGVTGNPTIPASLREFIGGFVAGILELTGANNVSSQSIDIDPQLWKWRIHWN
jgi:hypothetical protein